MIAETYLSHKFLRLRQEDLDTIQKKLIAIFGKVSISEKDFEGIIQLCFQDKKNDGNELNFSLLRKIGECDYNINVGKEAVIEALEYYNSILD
jgi:3-dehydroquinate synthase